MFKSIRNSIANFIAGDRTVHMVVDNAKSLTYPNAPAHMLNQGLNIATANPLKGFFSVSDLDDLSSTRLRDAIATLGAWSALARGFSEYEKVNGVRKHNDSKLSILIDEFHAWNSAAQNQMDDDAVELAVTKMSVVAPSKGSRETDEILARVKKVSIEEIRADRIKKAQTKTAIRLDMIQGYIASVWSWVPADHDYQMSSARALDKAIQTLEWIANWDSNNPAEQAAELLLIEDDIKLIRNLYKKERDSHNDDFVDGVLTSDGMMRMNERQA